MFLGWIAALNFLPPNPECGVFLAFPKPIRRDLASQVVTHLLSDDKAFASLSSRQHVTVTLDLLGQAFGLDVADERIISQVTELYRKWLLTDQRPAPMRDDVEHYIVEMLKHFSLLFTPREVGNALTHAKLCSVVLDVIDHLGREFATHLTVQTWESVLKIMLGICDHLFRLPEVESPLATALCPLLFRVTMSLWIRSTTQSGEMWDIYKTLILNWRHRKPIVAQWISTCTSFTHSILSLLYVFPAPRTTIVLQNQKSNDVVQLEQGLVFFFWYRLLHLMGDLETIESPEIHHEAMKGIHELAKLFYQNMDIKNPKLLPPDGNGILHIFAPFLLDAINIHRPGFDEGRAEALNTFMQICCYKATTDYEPTYLAGLYRGIQKGIAHSNLMLDIVLRSSEALFTNNLKGIRTLVPAFWWALKRALVDPGLNKLDKLTTPKEELRLHCYRIASYLLTYANVYSEQTFQMVCPNSDLFQASPDTKFSELRSLRSVLLTCLLSETNQMNLILLVNIIFNNIWEDPTSLKDFPTQLAAETMNPEKRKTWSPEVNAAILQAWNDTAHLFGTIRSGNPKLADNLMTNFTEILDELFRQQKISPNASPALVSHTPLSVTTDLIILTFKCMSNWIMQDQWILESQNDLPRDRTTLYKLLSYIFLGMTGRWAIVPGMAPPDTPPLFHPSEEVQNAAKNVLLLLMNKIDHFPVANDPSISSSLKTEYDIVATTDTCSKGVGIYVLDDRIISVVRHPRDEDGNFVTTLFVRDATGLYCWNTTLLFDPKPESEINPQQIEEISDYQLNTDSIISSQADEKLLSAIAKFIPEDEKVRQARLLQHLKVRCDNEMSILKQNGYHLKKNYVASPPKGPMVDPAHDTTASRLLMTHLGWNDANYRTRFFAIKDISGAMPQSPNASNPEKVIEDPEEELRSMFAEIDSTHERLRFTVGIFYVPGKYPTDHDIFSETKASPDFFEFTNALGKEVKLATHHGYTGNLHPAVTGETTLYYATHELETVFHVAPKMPYLSQTSQLYKRRLLLEDQVLIVWVEKLGDYKGFDFIKDSVATCQIIISPLTPQLFRIRVLRRQLPSQSTGSPNTNSTVHSVCNPIGPLMDEFIISKHTLPLLVRLTAINTLMAHSHHARPFTVRQKAINEFIKKHKNDSAFTQVYYNQTFT